MLAHDAAHAAASGMPPLHAARLAQFAQTLLREGESVAIRPGKIEIRTPRYVGAVFVFRKQAVIEMLALLRADPVLSDDVPTTDVG